MKTLLDTLNPFTKSHGGHWPFSVLMSLLLIFSVFLVGAGSGWYGRQVYEHRHVTAGGFIPSTTQPPFLSSSRIGGGPLAPAWYLAKYLVRIHQQAASNSCVGQTVSEMEEVFSKERGNPTAFSSGFIWNPLNGGFNQGTTYEAAFARVQAYGDAPLAAFPPDGASDYFVLPGIDAYNAAAPYKARSVWSLSPIDRYSIEYQLSSGRPLAVAFAWNSDLVNHFGSCGLVYYNSGWFEFYHSVIIVGYNQDGVVIVNSWGPEWGCSGQVTLSWSLLASVGAYIEVMDPAWSFTHPVSKAFPLGLWRSWGALHRKPVQSPYYKGRLSLVATSWLHHSKRYGGIVGHEKWDARNKVMKTTFTHYYAYSWPQHHWAVKWVKR